MSRKDWMAEKEREDNEKRRRIAEVWQVPEYAAEAFIELQDAVGEDKADAIVSFVKAMIKFDD